MIKKRMVKNEQGFSFVELMTVIGIIGILSAIALPNFLRSLPEKRLKNATRNLYADLQRARLLAVKENRSVRVWFNVNGDNSTYHFEEDAAGDPGFGIWDQEADDNEFGKTIGDYGAVRYGCNATPTNWNGSSSIPSVSSFSDNNFSFTSTGVISNSSQGSVYLQSENDPEVCYALTVTSFGGVKIRRFPNDWE